MRSDHHDTSAPCESESRVAASASASASASARGAGRVLPDNAVCTLAQLLGDVVALVDDELLVEDLTAVVRRSNCGQAQLLAP